ncbi:MAG: hypothetical protein ACKOAG_01085 [Candidatus Kapaibacterium sp.]
MISDAATHTQFAKSDAELLNLLTSSGERMKKQHRPLFRGDTRVVSLLLGNAGHHGPDTMTPPSRLDSLPAQAHTMLENLCVLLDDIDGKLYTIQTELYALQHMAAEANEVASIGLETTQRNNPFLTRIEQMIRQHMAHHPTEPVFDDTHSLVLRARKDAATITHLLSQYKVLANNIIDATGTSGSEE